MSDTIHDALLIGCEAMWRARGTGVVRFDHESLPPVRGWKHTFSMEPVARRKRVAEALFKAVMK